jgi:hypothetical protein
VRHFFCRVCYDLAEDGARNVASEAAAAVNGADETHVLGGSFPAQMDLECSEGVGSRTDLRGMMQSLVNNRFPGNALAQVDDYEQHVNSVCGGLFSYFMSAVPDQTPGMKKKIAMLLEQFGHLVDPSYSKTMWEVTDVLHGYGVSDRAIRGFSERGLAMCSSHLREHQKSEIQCQEWRFAKTIGEPGEQLVLITDDFHQIEGSRGLPRKKKWKIFSGSSLRQRYC